MDSVSIRINIIEQQFIQKGFNKHPQWFFIIDKVIPSIASKKCLLCKINFSNEYTTKRHFICKHEKLIPEKLFEEFSINKCEKCNILFLRKDKFNDHILKHARNESANQENLKLDDFWPTRESFIAPTKRKIDDMLGTENINNSDMNELSNKKNCKKMVRFSSVVQYENIELIDLSEDTAQIFNNFSGNSEKKQNDLVILDDENDDILKMENKVEIEQEMNNIKYQINQLKIRYSLLKEQKKRLN